MTRRGSRALAAAVAAPSVVQERIHQPSEPFPSWIDGGLLVSDRIVDTAPYVFGGSYVDGCLSRISTAALVNVTAGGGVPCRPSSWRAASRQSSVGSRRSRQSVPGCGVRFRARA